MEYVHLFSRLYLSLTSRQLNAIMLLPMSF